MLLFICLTLMSIIATLVTIYTTPGLAKVSVKNILMRCALSWAVGYGVVTCIRQIGGF